MSNRDRLKELLIDIFSLEEDEFSFDLSRDDIETWDSLGIVSMAVGVREVFGYHFQQAEALEIDSVADIIERLEAEGVSFAE